MTAKDSSPALGDQAGESLTDLLVERERQIRLLHGVYRNISTWGIGVGKLRVRASVGSNFIAIIFIVRHLLLGAGGVASILIWDGVRELGIALLVESTIQFR